MPCFMLRSMFPHVHMFRSTCLGFGLHAHMLDIMSMIISCLDLHVCMHVLCSYAYIRVFTWLYAWIHVLPCLCAKFLCLHACFYAYMSMSMLPHACVFGFMLFICFMLYSMCLCAPCHVCVPRTRLCLSCYVLL